MIVPENPEFQKFMLLNQLYVEVEHRNNFELNSNKVSNNGEGSLFAEVEDVLDQTMFVRSKRASSQSGKIHTGEHRLVINHWVRER